MKKILVVSLCVLSLVLIGCGGEDSGASTPAEDLPVEITLSLEEILDKMYESTDIEWPSLVKTPVDDENMEYMLGVSNFEFEEAMASEPMMTSQAHSVVLVKVDDEADIETIKTDIKENVDGRKWICVGVEDENILVDNFQNYIILIMDNEGSSELLNAFHEVMNS